jgi:amino acid adenylation domain-containing protein
MNASEIITELKRNNVFPRLTGNQLNLVGETNGLSKEFIGQIRDRKEELISFLRESIDELAFIPIPVLQKQDDYPLSNAQKRIWLLSQFEGGSSAYNIIAGIYLKGIVVKEALNKAFHTLIKRHESLRTVFREVDGELRQIILEDLPFNINYEDLSSTPQVKDRLKFERDELAGLKFDLENGPLIAVTLFDLSDQEHALLFNIHHIVSDGWSISVIIKEMMRFYDAYYKREDPFAEPLKIQYKEYAQWLTQRIEGPKGLRSRDFWGQQFSAGVEPLSLESDFKRPERRSFEGAVSKFCLKENLYADILSFCKEHQLTPFNFFRSTVCIFLSKLSGQYDFNIGTPVSGRNHFDLEDQVGLYVNTIPLRTEIDFDDSILDFLKKCSENSFRSFEFQDYPFDEIIAHSNLQHDPGRNPFFDVMLVLQRTDLAVDRISGTNQYSFELSQLDDYLYEASTVIRKNTLSKFDLCFTFGITPGNDCCLEIEYGTKLFKDNTIDRFFATYQHIVSQVLEDPEKAICAVEMVDKEEKLLLLERFNDKSVSYPTASTLISLFEEQVQRTPDNIALLFEETAISYQALNQQSNRLADYLREKYAIQPDDLIGLKLDRNEWMIIAILGVLKSGGAYVPIDPEYPEARINYIIEDSHCKLVIDKEELACFLGNGKKYNNSNLRLVNKPGDLAYVIYTSGTTGNPKGVLIEHKNVVRLFKTDKELFNFSAGDVWTLFHSYSFDFSVWEMFGALLYGGKLIVIPLETAKDPAAYLEVLNREGVTVLNQTPSSFYNLIRQELENEQANLQLRYVIFGGEALSPGKLTAWKERYPGIRLINMYGITETTVHVTYKEITQADIDSNRSNIGAPIPTLTCYVLDRNQNLLPIGVPGELYVGGEGLSRGYLNRQDLTSQRFIANPFRSGERLYRSGDRVKMGENGEMEYLGRLDDQVKIRGYRIELGEIEGRLQDYPGIDSAVVIARSDPRQGEKELVAYLVSGKRLDIPGLRAWLGTALPSYMLPGHYVQLDKLPLTANGKVDKKALPEPSGRSISAGIEYTAPRNPTEARLALIWQEILHKERIGAKDDFFDLGGHSLKMTRLLSRIHEEFQVRPALKDLFRQTTLEEQALLIQQTGTTAFAAISPAPVQPDYPLSSAQRRLWVLSQFEQSNIAYNMPGVFIFNGALDQQALAGAFAMLIARHEILRTIFKENEKGEVRQFIQSPAASAFSILYRDLVNEENEDIHRSFDLSCGPLLRACLYRRSPSEWIFTYVMHHIISDGWSMGILMEELLVFYRSLLRGEGNRLSPLKIQYKDYAVWQQAQLLGTAMDEHKRYWIRQMAGDLPVLELPADHPRPLIKTYKGGKIHKDLPSGILEEIRALTAEQEATLFMGLLAGVNAILYRYSGQKDIIVASPIAGREHTDLEGQIGFYVNTVAIRTRFTEEDSFRELVGKVREVTVASYEHQGYPFDELVEELPLARDMSRNALTDVLVALQNTETGQERKDLGLAELGGLQIRTFERDMAATSKFDLTFIFAEDASTALWMGERSERDGLGLTIEYNSDIYKESTVARMAEHLVRLLEAMTEYPSVPIGRLEYLTEREKHQLLTEFNDTETDYPKETTIVELFEQQVQRTPDNMALLFEETAISYQVLNQRSNRLANYLREKYAIQADDLIGIKLERSEWLVTALLGVLKAGGAYVPVDPEYPQERIDYILADSRCKAVIDEEELNRFWSEMRHHDPGNLVPVSGPGDLAYVIYTSGTTGNPKGALIEHKNVVRLFKTDQPLFDFTAGDVWTLFHSYCFDFSVWEMYGALLYGGKLVIIPSKTARDSNSFLEVLKKEGVTVLNQTPSSFYNLVKQELEQEKTDLPLRYVIFGGEALTPGKLDGWKKRYPATRLINMYGITETTVHVTYKEITQAEIDSNRSNIGKPIPTLSCYVLDENRHLVPPGVPGELYVGGEGVCRGYLNREELTRQRFITSPFGKGQRLYRSGDKVKMLENGEMEYMGRLDDQVKIRGYRIELGEIGSVLEGMDYIEEAIVMARKDRDGGYSLTAYFVSKKELNTSILRSELSRHLPEYMIPAHFVQLKQLPLTVNGKLDRKALPDPETFGLTTGAEYIAPGNTTEEKIAGIWKELLGKERISIRDSFFELGGDSITVLRMVSEVRKRLNLKIPVAFVYSNNTIENIAAYILDNKIDIDERDRIVKDKTATVKKDIDGLKDRILSSGTLPDKDNIEDIYPMSAIEKGMLFGSLLRKGLSVYHDQFAYRQVFAGFGIDRFRTAMELLVEKHSILRTCFNLSDYESEVQLVNKKIEFSIPFQDLARMTGADQEKTIRQYLQSELETPFDTSRAPLWRMSAFNLGGNKIGLAWQFHHAILDGWSNASFITELNNLYLKLGEDSLYHPGKLKAGYKDFVIQQEIDRQDQSVRNFWKEELSDCTRLDLFREEEEWQISSSVLDGDYLNKIERLAADLHTTVKAISLSAWLYLCKILNYDNEIVIGLVTNNRPECEDSDRILGCFLNSIPLRMTVDGNERGVDWIARVQNKLIELKENERLSLAEIALLHMDQQETGNPFFDIFFNYVDFHVYKAIEKDALAQEESSHQLKDSLLAGRERTNTHLDFSISVTTGSYDITIRLNKRLKCGFSAEKLGELYLKILTSIVGTPDRALQAIDTLRPDEKRKLLVSFNDTEADYPKQATMVKLLEEQVDRTPESVAVLFEETTLTYQELNERSNRLAHYLRQKYDVKADDLLGIRLERGEWMIIAILAVLKSGGAYVPIDPDYPRERIDYILTDSHCKTVIDEQELKGFKAEQFRYDQKNPVPVSGPGDLAYVIYTSGSTGHPKGVMIEHRNTVAFIAWCRTEFGEEDFDVVLAGTSICFDLSVFEIFYTLSCGKKLRVLPNLLSIRQYLTTAEKVLLNTVPAVVGSLLSEEADFGSVRVLNMAGEPVPSGIIAGLDCEKIAVRNLYGPTEDTTYSTRYRIKNDRAILIGRPIANTWLYILDNHLDLLPLGLVGEICLSGAGLARGYLNKPELTAEKFLVSPFRPGERIYRTGDLGRWLPDGNIEFIGRRDSQVKIRGVRIELGEIEVYMQGHPDIDSAVVTAQADRYGEKELVAYVVSGRPIDVPAIRSWLAGGLPSYMIPSRYVELREWPLTPSGKVDRKKLPDPEALGLAAGTEYVAPGNEIEEQLVSIWQELLGREKIGIKDNFFELGGHSLKMLKLVLRIKATFSVQFAFEDILKAPTIESISEHIQFIVEQNKRKQNREKLIRVNI